MNFRLSVQDWTVNPVVTVLTETIVPAVVLMWGRRVYFSPATVTIHVSEEVLFWTAVAGSFIWFVIFKKIKGTWLRKPAMEFRHVLLALRRLSVGNTYRIHRIVQEASNKADRAETVALFEEGINFEGSVKDVLNRLFLAFSAGNSNLDHHFRVCLFEPRDGRLRITQYANSEDEPPRCMSIGRTFEKGEGSAGWAWYLMKPFILEDLDSYRKERDKGRVDPTYFIDEHAEQEKIKSVASIPVILRESDMEQLRAVVTIDTDLPRFFRETTKGERDLRVRSYPLIRAIGLLYELRALIYAVRKT